MNSDDFKKKASDLLLLVEQQERGEITDLQLLRAWKDFYRQGSAYLQELQRQIKIN